MTHDADLIKQALKPVTRQDVLPDDYRKHNWKITAFPTKIFVGDIEFESDPSAVPLFVTSFDAHNRMLRAEGHVVVTMKRVGHPRLYISDFSLLDIESIVFCTAEPKEFGYLVMKMRTGTPYKNLMKDLNLSAPQSPRSIIFQIDAKTSPIAHAVYPEGEWLGIRPDVCEDNIYELNYAELSDFFVHIVKEKRLWDAGKFMEGKRNLNALTFCSVLNQELMDALMSTNRFNYDPYTGEINFRADDSVRQAKRPRMLYHSDVMDEEPIQINGALEAPPAQYRLSASDDWRNATALQYSSVASTSSKVVTVRDMTYTQERKRQRTLMRLELEKQNSTILLQIHGSTICYKDLFCLEFPYFTNDEVLTYLMEDALCTVPPDMKSEIHLFSSFFFSKFYEPVISLKGAFEHPDFWTRRYETNLKNFDRVRGFTRKVDVFAKKFLIIPINLMCHWFGVIIVNPMGMINKTDGPYENNERTRVHGCRRVRAASWAVLLNSLLPDDNPDTYHVLDMLRDFFENEFRTKKTEADGRFERTRLDLVIPTNMAQQQNEVDCGLYFASYIDAFLQHSEPFENLRSMSQPCIDWENSYPGFSEQVVNCRACVIRKVKSHIKPDMLAHYEAWSKKYKLVQPMAVLKPISRKRRRVPPPEQGNEEIVIAAEDMPFCMEAESSEESPDTNAIPETQPEKQPLHT